MPGSISTWWSDWRDSSSSADPGGEIGLAGALVGHLIGGDIGHVTVDDRNFALLVSGQPDIGDLADPHAVHIGRADLRFDHQIVITGTRSRIGAPAPITPPGV